jgi:hypothetical protein
MCFAGDLVVVATADGVKATESARAATRRSGHFTTDLRYAGGRVGFGRRIAEDRAESVRALPELRPLR